MIRKYFDPFEQKTSRRDRMRREDVRIEAARKSVKKYLLTAQSLIRKSERLIRRHGSHWRDRGSPSTSLSVAQAWAESIRARDRVGFAIERMAKTVSRKRIK